jgi:hypothetical protein
MKGLSMKWKMMKKKKSEAGKSNHKAVAASKAVSRK